MPEKLIFFFDVDGVLNACPPLPDHDVVQKEGYPICIPRGTKERIARLLKVFEPCWATTWRDKAHPNFAPDLNLGETAWPHIGGDYGSAEHRECSGAWKLPALLKYAGERPWVWADDDGLWEVQEHRRGEHAASVPGGIRLKRGLVLCPATNQGLTDLHVAQALAFAEEMTKPEAIADESRNPEGGP